MDQYIIYKSVYCDSFKFFYLGKDQENNAN